MKLHARFTDSAQCPTGARWDPELKMMICPKETKHMTIPAPPTDKQIAAARQGLKHASGNAADLRAKEHMAKTGEKDYGRALHAALAADPQLKHNYLFGGE
jgi:hypothetical protein